MLESNSLTDPAADSNADISSDQTSASMSSHLGKPLYGVGCSGPALASCSRIIAWTVSSSHRNPGKQRLFNTYPSDFRDGQACQGDWKSFNTVGYLLLTYSIPTFNVTCRYQVMDIDMRGGKGSPHLASDGRGPGSGETTTHMRSNMRKDDATAVQRWSCTTATRSIFPTWRQCNNV